MFKPLSSSPFLVRQSVAARLLLGGVLLEKMWEVRCVCSNHSRPLPTWRANLLPPDYFSEGFSHGTYKIATGQEPELGFFPDRRALRCSSQ